MDVKTYEVLINRKAANRYIIGRISGIIYVLTGMPEVEMGWGEDGPDAMIPFKGTEEQSKAVHECLNKLYPKAYAGMREIE